MKRLFDILVSLSALVMLSPIILVVAMLVKAEGPGSVLFTQQRVGRNGELFSIYKFRSMVTDAAEKGPYFTQGNDPRITQVGAMLRRTSLDELPQLLNVLLGQMSLVGPRPNVPAQRQEYNQAQWDKRNSVRPGITGLAQAVKRSSATPEERTSLDLEYVDKTSLTFDMYVLLLTVKQVVLGKGAN